MVIKMDYKTMELENRIIELEKKINTLERHETNRRVGKAIKTLITLLIIGAIFYGGYKGYNYVKNELPKVIDDKIKDVKNNIKLNENLDA